MLDEPDIKDRPIEIDGPRAYFDAMRTLNKKSGPPALLRMIMNAFESYRQARKIGWSRPWNKYGVTTFRSYRLRFPADDELLGHARDILSALPDPLPNDAQAFVDELLAPGPARERLMGFLFFHEIRENGTATEGVTLSLGRINERKRHRDRLDIVFETPMGSSDGQISRLRVYVDPFHGVAPPKVAVDLGAADMPAEAAAVFADLCDLYADWGREDARLWDHWTSQYIDYFGPRGVPLTATHFPVGPDGR